MPVRLKWVGGVLVVLLALGVNRATAADQRLVDAAMSRDGQTVSALLKQKVDVNVPQADGATALHWAAHWDDVHTVDALLQAGARVNAANEYGVTPLWLACENRSTAMAARLLAAGASPNAALPTGETVLMTAARTGNTEIVKALLANGAAVNAREHSHEQSALMWAISEGHLEVVRALIEAHADLNARTSVRAPRPRPEGQLGPRNNERIDSGFTPLLFAARQGDLTIFRLLLDHGADLHATSTVGVNALLVATVRGHVELATQLLALGMDPNFNGPGYTPLHWAAGTWESVTTHDYSSEIGEWRAMSGIPNRVAKLDLIKALLAHGADINALVEAAPPRYGFSFGRNVIGATAFYLAASVADIEVMRLLLANGADPLRPVKDNTTPLLAAAGLAYVDEETTASESRFLDTIKLLVQLGADVRGGNNSGETALHAAAYEGFDNIAQFLVEQGADVNARNRSGRTPVSLADGVNVRGKLYIHPSTAALLRKLGGTTDTAAEEAARRRDDDSTRRVPAR